MWNVFPVNKTVFGFVSLVSFLPQFLTFVSCSTVKCFLLSFICLVQKNTYKVVKKTMVEERG